MRVKIGPYKDWVGPYQIADTLKIFGVSEETCHKVGEKLANTKLNDLCRWIHSKRKRKIKVKLDYYDHWNAYHTLALIILPVLDKIKETKHGAACVDDEDVPEELRSSSAPPVEPWESDSNTFARWDWVLDEMIFAFQNIVDDSWEDQFHTGKIDFVFTPVDAGGINEVPKEDAELFRLDKGPNDTHKWDQEGYKKYNARIDNGLKLFGKYYRGLWD